MRQAVELVGILNLVLFAAIAVVCVRQWSTERAPTALWAALAFVTLAAVIVVGKLLPDEPQAPSEAASSRTTPACMNARGAVRGLTMASGMVAPSYMILGTPGRLSRAVCHAAILSDSKPTARPKKSDWFQRRMARKFSVVR